MDAGLLLPLTTSEAARILGVSPDRVRALERQGRLSAFRTPTGRRVFDVHDVERLAVERAAQHRVQRVAR